MIKEDKKEKIKLSLKSYDKIKTNCFADNLWFYIKTNIIRAPLEAAITLYLAEILIILSDIFTDKVLGIGKVIPIVLIPIFLSILLCGFYLFYVSRNILKCFITIIDKHEDKNISDEAELYKYTDDAFLKELKRLHIYGAIAYVAGSSVLAWVITLVFDYIEDEKKMFFFFWIVFLGLLFGVGWNWYGYWSDSRIDWSKIFIRFKNFHLNEYEKIRAKKYKAYQMSVITQLAVMILVMIVIGWTALNLNERIIHQGGTPNSADLLTTLISYASIATMFLIVLKIYAEQLYNLFYRMESDRENDADIIFPNIFDLTEKKEN